MTDDRDRIVLSKTTSIGRGLPAVVAVAFLAVVLAVLKPWGTSAPAPRASGGPLGSGATSTATRQIPRPQPTPDPATIPCLTYTDWRAMVIERTATEETRHWIAVVPVAATGPSDPAIPFVAIGSEHVVGLGTCVPDGIRVTGPPVVHQLLRQGALAVAKPGELERLVPTGRRLADIYAAPGPGGTWSAGLYVIGLPVTRVSRGRAVVEVLSFGIRILTIVR